MSDTKKTKAPIGVFSPIIDAVRTKCALFSVLSLIIAILAYSLGNEDIINVYHDYLEN